CGRGRRDCGGEVRQYAQLCVRDITLRKVVRAADERSGLGCHRDLHLGIDQAVSRLIAGMVRGRHRIPVIVESGRPRNGCHRTSASVAAPGQRRTRPRRRAHESATPWPKGFSPTRACVLSCRYGPEVTAYEPLRYGPDLRFLAPAGPGAPRGDRRSNWKLAL